MRTVQPIKDITKIQQIKDLLGARKPGMSIKKEEEAKRNRMLFILRNQFTVYVYQI